MTWCSVKRRRHAGTMPPDLDRPGNLIVRLRPMGALDRLEEDRDRRLEVIAGLDALARIGSAAEGA